MPINRTTDLGVQFPKTPREIRPAISPPAKAVDAAAQPEPAKVGFAEGDRVTQEDVIIGESQAPTAEQASKASMSSMLAVRAAQNKAAAEGVQPQEVSSAEGPAAATRGSTGASAAALYDAIHTWFFGLGNDKQAIFNVLRDKSPEEVMLIDHMYRDHYGRDLLGDLKGDLSKADFARTEALLKGDLIAADAAGLHQALKGKVAGLGINKASVRAKSALLRSPFRSPKRSRP